MAGAPITITIELQGARAVAQHWAAVAAITIPAASQITGFFGGYLASVAREIHAPNVDTGATYASISPANFSAGANASIDVGPSTFYSVFQEFGYVHHGSGKFIQNPFMIPAADAVGPLFISAIIQLAEIAATRTAMSGPGAGAGNAAITGVRSALYSFSKFAGDIQVFGIGSSLAGARQASLQSARLLGDVSSGMKGAVAKRVTIRASGAWVSGRVRAASTAAVTGPTAAWSSGATRLIDRVGGRIGGTGLKGL